MKKILFNEIVKMTVPELASLLTALQLTSVRTELTNMNIDVHNAVDSVRQTLVMKIANICL